MFDVLFGLSSQLIPSHLSPYALPEMSPTFAEKITYTSATEAYQAALTLHQSDLFFEAISAYQTVIQLDPNFDAAYINLSLILIGLGQLTDAETNLKQVLTLPDRPEIPASIHALAYYNLAIIANRQNDPINALHNVQQALVIAPNFTQAQDFFTQLKQLTTPQQ